MHTGALGLLASQSGVRFSEVIHEGTARWHQLDDGIPADIRTVILQEGDPLALRLHENPALARDLTASFQVSYRARSLTETHANWLP